MPLYEYACQKCGKHTERIEKYDGPALKKCPHCGGKVERLLSAPAIQFKGSGWYVTDYAKSGSSGGASADTSADKAEAKAADTKKDGKESTPAPAAPKETKEKKKAPAKAK